MLGQKNKKFKLDWESEVPCESKRCKRAIVKLNGSTKGKWLRRQWISLDSSELDEVLESIFGLKEADQEEINQIVNKEIEAK